MIFIHAQGKEGKATDQLRQLRQLPSCPPFPSNFPRQEPIFCRRSSDASPREVGLGKTYRFFCLSFSIRVVGFIYSYFHAFVYVSSVQKILITYLLFMYVHISLRWYDIYIYTQSTFGSTYFSQKYNSRGSPGRLQRPSPAEAWGQFFLDRNCQEEKKHHVKLITPKSCFFFLEFIKVQKNAL